MISAIFAKPCFSGTTPANRTRSMVKPGSAPMPQEYWLTPGMKREPLLAASMVSIMDAPDFFGHVFSASGSDPKRGTLFAKKGDYRERGDAAGLWIFRRDVLDRHRKARGIGFHLDAMNVARYRRIGPDLEPGPVGADAGQRQRHRDIQIGRESLGRLARGALEDPQRFGDPLDIDVVLDDIGRAGEPWNRLSRHHADRMDGADRRRGHGIQPNQGARRHHDLTAMLFGKCDQVLMVEQSAGAENDSRLSRCHERFDDRPDEFARRTFDDDIGDVAKRADRQDRGLYCQARKPAAVLVRILRRHRGQGQSFYSPVERLRHLLANGSQPGNGHPQVGS